MKDYKKLTDDELFQELGKVRDLITIYYTEPGMINDFTKTIRIIEEEIKSRGLEWTHSSF
jgi:hypothetical protein